MKYAKTHQLGEKSYSSYDPNIERWYSNIPIDLHLLKQSELISRLQGQCEMLEDAKYSTSLNPFIEAFFCTKIDLKIDPRVYCIELLDSSSEAFKRVQRYSRKTQRGNISLYKDIKDYITSQKIGAYRTTPTWLGHQDISKASYVPPHEQEVTGYLHALDRQLSLDLPSSLQLALAHCYLFLLLPLNEDNSGFIRSYGYHLSKEIYNTSQGIPITYMISRHLKLYNNALTSIYEKEDLSLWIRTFLDFCTESLQKSLRDQHALQLFYERSKETLDALRKVSNFAPILLQHIHHMPSLDIHSVIKLTDLSKPNATHLINLFEEQGIITQVSKGKRNRKFVLTSFLQTISS